jgi:integrase
MPGHILKRGKVWYVVVSRGRDPVTGKRLRGWHRAGPREKDAKALQVKLSHDLLTGAYMVPSKMTVDEFAEMYLAECESRLTARTFYDYESILRLHVRPRLGRISLSALNPEHMVDLLKHWREDGRTDGSGGLSPQKCHNNYRALRTMLRKAVKWGYLARNPLESIDPPRVQRKEVQALSEQEVRTLIEAAGDTVIGRAIRVAVCTGMRRGELLGLRWSDIDFEERTLHIQQTVYRLPGRGFFFQPPKNDGSARQIFLPSTAVRALVRQRAKQGEVKLALGASYEDHDLVFAAPDGKPQDPSVFYRRMTRVAERAGVQHVHPHKLRHTCASTHLHAKTHPKVVSEILGHASVNMTLDTYSHLIPDMQADAAEELDRRLAIDG